MRMRAAAYHRYGGAEELEIESIERPEPRADELLIRVYAAEVTKADCEMRRFKFPVKWFWLPLRLAIGLFRPRRPVLGGYFAGVVEKTAAADSGFEAGDAVYGSTGLRFGAHGEYLCLPADQSIVEKPRKLSFEAAAAVPLGGLNAIHFIEKSGLRAGERILINGAGGSIGSFAVQIAKSIGAEVTAVDIGFKREMLLGIGADHFIDYTRTDFTRGNQTWDVIFDMVASSNYGGCIDRLNPGGRYLIGNPRLIDMIRSMITPRLTGKSVFFQFAGETREQLRRLGSMIDAGQITPVIDRVYPLEDIAEAHRRVESEQRRGIVVVSMAVDASAPGSGPG